MGTGAMSGRAGGYCAGYDAPGYANPGAGRGMGKGFGGGRGLCGRGNGGGGRGWRNMFHATGLPRWMRSGGDAAPEPEMEKQSLKRQASILQAELERIKNRLGEIETEATEE
jgi:hypothetical protein